MLSICVGFLSLLELLKDCQINLYIWSEKFFLPLYGKP